MIDPAPPPLALPASEVLELPLRRTCDIHNATGAETIGAALAAILAALWEDRAGNVDGKRPFGNSSWRYDFYEALGDAGLIKIIYDEHEPLDIEELDSGLGDRYILAACNALAPPG